MELTSRQYFDALYEKNIDPWHITHSWYEQRKRGLVAAILPRRRFRSMLEPGCGTGELTLELGPRCERILAGDLSDAAVKITCERWRKAMELHKMECIANFTTMAIPQQWPLHLGSAFDLIVISEFAYYLDDASLKALPALISCSLVPDGVVLACHWKRAFDKRKQTTQIAHALIHEVPGLHRFARYEDADFLLDVWTNGGKSVAALEGLT